MLDVRLSTSYTRVRDASKKETGAPEGYWFGALARYLGPAYLRNAFTKGTEQEVDFLVDALGLTPGQEVLDVGCGPGRHSLALARRGFIVLGVDGLRPDMINEQTMPNLAAMAARGVSSRDHRTVFRARRAGR